MKENDSVAEEIKERQSAELEFVSAAYSTEEAWISTKPRNTVHRRLDLSIPSFAVDDHHQPSKAVHQYPNGENHKNNNEDNPVPIDLALTMPIRYPIDNASVLQVDASLLSFGPKSQQQQQQYPLPSTKLSTIVRKIVLDAAIPSLLLACRKVAAERAEAREEAVFDTMTAAMSWAEDVWPEMASAAGNIKGCGFPIHHQSDERDRIADSSSSRKMMTLGRRMIYSHHIIARSKRTALSSLASELNLGGYSKIGWPGLILIEGAEEDCVAFVDTIRRWRWQRLVVRGEEREHVREGEGIDSKRKLPEVWKELPEDGGSSKLAGICAEAGLENLFLTSMNIYREDNGDNGADADDKNNDSASIVVRNNPSIDAVYGVLVHVDHMNNQRSYCKWIQKACKTNGCSVLIKRCRSDNDYLSSSSVRKPIILVGLWGEISDVKQVLKRWRTSRVDVDSKGNPCLERMMTVLVEGVLEKPFQDILSCKDCGEDDDGHDSEEFDTSVEGTLNSLRVVGGWKWEDALSKLLI